MWNPSNPRGYSGKREFVETRDVADACGSGKDPARCCERHIGRIYAAIATLPRSGVSAIF
jgi:hypothetical protein